MGYDLSRAAERDLINLYLWGSEKFGGGRADQYIAELRDAFALLAAHPAMARELHQFDPPIRAHPHGKHVILYVVREQDIFIVRIRHSRENWLNSSAI
ncbi:type II toxin-antitoxin system RelE/ParE family toxin [Sphingomonas koreensis]|nr:type II toxin-antitoxin system RelE/ParE family toxin [Sphingomonas koreensis]